MTTDAAQQYARLQRRIERRETSTSSLAHLLTLDRQRAGLIEHMGACSTAGALETVEEMLSDALDYAHYRGPFWRDSRR